MAVEEEYLDVLQNIEFAIVSTSHDHPEMVDGHVIWALEAVINSYRAEHGGKDAGGVPRLGRGGRSLSGHPQHVRLASRRLSPREERGSGTGTCAGADQVDEILLCLKRILKSVNRWNKSGGQRGYLTFIVQYVK